MKKNHILFLFVALFVFGVSKTSLAQGNLQFNQVILLDIAGAGTQAVSVPAGKVWKIESVSMGSSGSTPSVFLRNSGLVNIAHFSTSSSVSATYPFWLPSGFTGSFLNNYPSTRCTISIIEFNVVP
jgi:hypothetical protein